MPSPLFVHLHIHTDYSIVDGLVGVKSLIKAAQAMHMPALAITDHCNLFAMVKFYRAAQAAGIKPIVGAELCIKNSADEKKPYRLVLLCQSTVGYKNLTQLLSRAYLEGQHLGLVTIEKEWLEGCSEGLIALSGAREGDIGQALLGNQPSAAKQLLQYWLNLFPQRFYIELQRTGREHEDFYVQAAIQLAGQTNTPVVATNDTRFLHAEDFDAHEARVCIHGGWVLNDPRREKCYSPKQYLRSPQEMAELFADIPAALENSVEIAKRCNLELSLGKSFLPNFPVPVGMTIDDYFQQEAQQGLEQRFALFAPTADFTQRRKSYEERLQLEINVIRDMGFTGYFLIVADFIRWAKQQHIFVGPGRGSGAGSLVAYALSITDLDPLEHDLLFERFLNPERVSVADFDIDFCMEGRDRVIDYVAQKYGRDSVAQIITYGTMAARAVVRDVGRVLGYPYGFVDKIAKLIPFELGMTLQKALVDEALLLERYQREDEVKTLIDLAMKLEGVPRNVGKHAGGVVIAPSLITDFVPLYCEPDGKNRVTQLDKDDVEAVGLVKFDFLGLRTLTIMDWALQTINQRRKCRGEDPIDINRLPLDDATTYDLLKSCQTTAVFQLESRGFRDLVRRLQPDCFEEIIALVALFRPGPLQSGMVDDFLDRKHGRAPVIYPHPLLEPVLRNTYGVLVYQEQVMQIAQILAGYTLGNADILRKAMGKKKPEEMAKQREIFVNGAKERQVDAHVANQIFDLMEKFADYGFNKSHSAAYALLSYQTAWLKAHYPAEFMAAVLSSDMDNTDKVVRYLEDSRRIGLVIDAPHINSSQYRFTVDDTGKIIYGLGAIKGVGSAAVEIILHNRQEYGAFKNLFEFCARVDTRKVNRKVLEALIRSGAMDCFNEERATLMASLNVALQAADQQERMQRSGQVDLFAEYLFVDEEQHYVKVTPWSEEQRLLGEKETLGWYISGHPMARFERELSHFVTSAIADLKPDREKTVLVAGYVVAVKIMQTKSGGRMAFLSLSDRTGRIELAVFPQLFENCRELLVKDKLLVVEGEVTIDEFTEDYKISARQLYDMDQVREKFVNHLIISLKKQQVQPDFFGSLQNILKLFVKGKCPIIIRYEGEEETAKLALGDEWRVTLNQDLLESLYQLCGRECVELVY